MNESEPNYLYLFSQRHFEVIQLQYMMALDLMENALFSHQIQESFPS